MRKEEYYDDLETKMDEKANERFITPPSYNKPQRSESVSEYIRRKYGKGSDADGQEMSEKVPSE